jgi:hypothetical protein
MKPPSTPDPKTDALRQRMIQQAREADGLPPSPTEAGPRAPAASEGPGSTQEPEATDKGTRPADAAGATPQQEPETPPTPTPPAQPKPADKPEAGPKEAAPTDAKEGTPYQKAQKDGERLDRSWKKLNEEKAELDRQRKEWEQQNRGTAPAPSAQQQPPTAAATGPYETRESREYDDAAKDFEANGEYDLALQASRRADALRKAEYARQHQAKSAEARHLWETNAQKILDATPDLNDADTPIAKATREILQGAQHLYLVPDGFSQAVNAARWKVSATEADALRAENGRLKAENERLLKATQPATDAGSSGPPPAPKDFRKLPKKEQRSKLLAMAAQADRGP